MAGLSSLIGEYRVKVDDKGRAKLPSDLKRQLQPGDQLRFVVKKGFEDSVELFPWSTWEETTADLKARINRFNPAHREFLRLYLDSAKELTLDAADRLLFPAQLLQGAGIAREIVFMAAMDRIELWAPERLDAKRSAGDDRLSELANKLLGGTPDGI